MRLERWLATSLLVLVVGCGDDDGTPAKRGTSASSGGPDDPPIVDEADAQPPSPNPRVRFKGGDVLATDLARALSLDADELCTELGTYSCAGIVHTVTLGGVDPYERQLYEASRQTSATAPLAAERVVLAACVERAKRDLANPSEAAIFIDLPIADGRLTDAKAPQVAAAIDALYVGLLARHATQGETNALATYYAEVESSGDAAPAERWASLACFAIGSSVESLFY